MSFIVKGVEFPKNCLQCPCYSTQFGDCQIIEDYIKDRNTRLDNCPLVEIPVCHGRLIDADVLVEDLKHDAMIAFNKYQNKDARDNEEMQYLRDEYNIKSNAAGWLRSNRNKVYLEAENYNEENTLHS